MATFLPFRAYRPKPELAKAVASKPYDVLNKKEALQECADNPLSFYHVVKPEIDFPDGVSDYAPEVYQKGRENFDKLVGEGVMVKDEQDQFYLYELEMNGHQQTGIVGCCAVDDYFDNKIKKHELTRPVKEEDRKNHIRAGKFINEPVFFAYPKVIALDEIVAKAKEEAPVTAFTSEDGVQHRIWQVNKPEWIETIIELFEEKVPSIYIADGHHRTAAAAGVTREIREAAGLHGDRPQGLGYFMATLFPDDQLQIMDYNRVIKDLNGMTSNDFLTKMAEKFEVEKMESQYKPDALHTFGLYLDKTWYKLTAKADTFDANDPIGVLDVTILSKNILEPILNIVDLRTDKRIEFVGGIRGLGELERRVDSGEMRLAFAHYPISMQQLIDVSDNDLLMPPKVTWFEPKLRSGLFVYSLEDRLVERRVSVNA